MFKCMDMENQNGVEMGDAAFNLRYREGLRAAEGFHPAPGGKSMEGAMTEEFPCLHRTPRGRIMHWLEIDRLVVDFKGIYLVLRAHEFLRVQRRLARLLECPQSRMNLEKGEGITLRDATGGRTIILSLSDIRELSDLLTAGSRCLEKHCRMAMTAHCRTKAPSSTAR